MLLLLSIARTGAFSIPISIGSAGFPRKFRENEREEGRHSSIRCVSSFDKFTPRRAKPLNYMLNRRGEGEGDLHHTIVTLILGKQQGGI